MPSLYLAGMGFNSLLPCHTYLIEFMTIIGKGCKSTGYRKRWNLILKMDFNHPLAVYIFQKFQERTLLECQDYEEQKERVLA